MTQTDRKEKKMDNEEAVIKLGELGDKVEKEYLETSNKVYSWVEMGINMAIGALLGLDTAKMLADLEQEVASHDQS